jgi:cytochrome oxidase Cu insertion factor (SCO1/SenC/PrrC family)
VNEVSDWQVYDIEFGPERKPVSDQEVEVVDKYNEDSELESDGNQVQKKVINFQREPSIEQIEKQYQVFEDDTGNSESSEGIVDHKPFQSAVNLQSKDFKRVRYQADDQIDER